MDKSELADGFPGVFDGSLPVVLGPCGRTVALISVSYWEGMPCWPLPDPPPPAALAVMWRVTYDD